MSSLQTEHLKTTVTLDPSCTVRHPTAHSQITMNPNPSFILTADSSHVYNPYSPGPSITNNSLGGASHTSGTTHSLYAPSFVGQSQDLHHHKFVKWNIKFDSKQTSLDSICSTFNKHRLYIDQNELKFVSTLNFLGLVIDE